MRKRRRPDERDGTNRRSRGSGKPLFHISGSSVIADNARDGYASNHIFEDDSPVTPANGAAIRQHRWCEDTTELSASVA